PELVKLMVAPLACVRLAKVRVVAPDEPALWETLIVVRPELTVSPATVSEVPLSFPIKEKPPLAETTVAESATRPEKLFPPAESRLSMMNDPPWSNTNVALPSTPLLPPPARVNFDASKRLIKALPMTVPSPDKSPLKVWLPRPRISMPPVAITLPANV